MVKNLLLLLLISFVYSGCEKEKGNSGGTLPGGSWYIKSIKGLNGFNNSGLAFTTGKFTFKEDGSLEYRDAANVVYNGKWSSKETYETGYCYTDADGSQVCNPYWDNTLELQVDGLPGGQIKKASFMAFTFIDANNFTAVLAPNGNPTHEYSFTRN
jgi:hypothetical protein